MGFSMLPFLAVYYRSSDGGELSAGFIVASGAAMTLGTAFASSLLGRLGDRYGHRLSMLTAVLLQIVTISILLVSSGPASCILAYIAAGMARGGISISGMNMMFETCPHDSRMAHIAAGNIIISSAAFGTPLLVGLFGQWIGVRTVFFISLAFSSLALLWTAFLVREPREHMENPYKH